MPKFVRILILLTGVVASAWSVAVWASCESRARGPNPPLAGLLARAVSAHVLTLDEVRAFSANREWYNPKTRFPLPSDSKGPKFEIFNFESSVYLVTGSSSATIASVIVQLTTPTRHPDAVSGGDVCEPRLHTQRSPIVGVLAQALEQGVWTREDFAAFVRAGEWSNPFVNTRTHLLRSRFRTAFAMLDAALTEEQRQAARLDAADLLAKLAGKAEVAREAKRDTETVFSPQLFPLPALHGDYFGDYPGSSIAWLHGRPILLKVVVERTTFKRHAVLLDPFHPDPAQRLFMFPEAAHANGSKQFEFFTWNGQLHALDRKNRTFYNLETRQNVSKDFQMVEIGAVSAETAEGSVFLQPLPPQLKALTPGAKWEPLFPSESFGMAKGLNVSLVEQRDFVMASDGKKVYVRDLSGLESFSPIALPERVYLEANGSLVFRDLESGEWMAAVTLVPVGRWWEFIDTQIYRLRDGAPLAKLAWPLGPVHAMDINGKTWLVNASQLAGNEPKLLLGDPRTGEKIESPPFAASSASAFPFREHTLLAGMGSDQLSIYDHATASVQTIPLLGLGDGLTAQVLTFAGETYLVADNGQTGLPYFFRLLTHPRRSPAGAGDSGDGCEPRLRGPREPIVRVFAQALEKDVWQLDDLRAFVQANEWRNPFLTTKVHLLRERFRIAFAILDAELSEERRQKARAELEQLLLERDHADGVAHQASSATFAILSPVAMPLPRISASLQTGQPGSSIAWLHGRPILLKEVHEVDETKSHAVLLDPFHPDPSQRLFEFPEADHIGGSSHFEFFTWNNQLHALDRRNSIVYNLETRQNVSPQFKNKLGKSMAITKTGQAILSSTMIKPLEGRGAWKPLFPGEEIANAYLSTVLRFEGPDIVMLASQNFLHFRDLSKEEPLPSIEFARDGSIAEANGTLIFHDRASGEPMVAVTFKKYLSGGWNTYTQVFSLRDGRPLAKLEWPIGELQALTLDGTTWLINSQRVTTNSSALFFGNPLTGEVKPGRPFPASHTSTVFTYRGEQYVAALGDGELVTVNLDSRQAQEFKLPGSGIGYSSQIFEYQGGIYLVADNSASALPHIFQLITPTRPEK